MPSTPSARAGAGCSRCTSGYVDALVEVKRQEAIGQDSLFGAFGGDEAPAGGADAFDGLPPVPRPSGTSATLLAFEREMLGLYVSDHPLLGIEHVLAAARRHLHRALMGDDPPAGRAPRSRSRA